MNAQTFWKGASSHTLKIGLMQKNYSNMTL